MLVAHSLTGLVCYIMIVHALNIPQKILKLQYIDKAIMKV